MKHEELHIRAHNAGTNTRLAMSRFTSKSSVIAKRAALAWRLGVSYAALCCVAYLFLYYINMSL